MTRTPFSIIVDGTLRYIPGFIIRAADNIPSKAMKKLKRNRELVNELAKERIQSGLDLIRKGAEGKKDVLSQIGENLIIVIHPILINLFLPSQSQ